MMLWRLGLLAFLTITAAAPLTAAPAGGDLPFAVQARRLGGMRAQAAALLVQGGQGGPLPMEVLAAAASAGHGEERQVAVLVEIEGPTLLAVRERDEVVGLELYAYALTAEGSVEDFFTQRFRLPLETLGERIFEGGVKFVGSLALPPGEYSLRVLLLESPGERFSLRTRPLTVPAPGDASPHLLAPLLAEPPDRWLLVRQDVTPPAVTAEEAAATGEEEEREEEAEPPPAPAPSPEEVVRPLLVGPEATLPSAFPVLEAASEVEVHLLAAGLGEPPAVAVRIEPEATGGGAAPTVPLTLVARLATPLPGAERLSGRFLLPRLPTGVYRLVFTAGTAEAPPMRALVLEELPLAEALVWGQLRSLAAALEEGAAAGGPIELPRRRKKRQSALAQAARERYTAALERAVASGHQEALAALTVVEREIFAADPGEGLEALAVAEAAVAEELGAFDPEALVPLVSYHADLYRLYRAQGEFALATHARVLVRLLVERYLQAVDVSEAETPGAGEGARRLAAQALITLAREMLAAGLQSAAGAALERALELDEGNEGALLLTAAVYEKGAEYRMAVGVLERLVATNPKSAEGRLRLALNRGRLGDREGAERTLRRLIAESNPPWTLTVAYSELARAYLASDRVAEAVSLLRQGVDRLPQAGRLYIQLAYALDRQRSFHDARQLLDRLPVTPAGAASPRHRYQSWPRQGLAEVEDRIREGAVARQPLLAGALAELSAAGGGRGGAR